MRTLMVCADDFGMAPGVSRGIARLALGGRLDAVSCVTTGPGWPQQAVLLRELPAAVQRGLHINLTEGEPLSAALRAHWPRFPSLGRLLLLSQARRLPAAALADELAAQTAAFIDATGAPPDHLDGHQHVHGFPVVRRAVLALQRRLPVPTAVRSTARVAGADGRWKRWVIEATGGRTFARALRRQGVPHNAVLLGAYDFVTADYRRLMQAWLAQVPTEGALLFCHPAEASPAALNHDPIAAARLREAAYLGSTAFDDDLAAAGVHLGPVWRTPLRSSAVAAP